MSTAANVSLGYLSEIERGQKEASSELLAAICEALGAALSEVLREARLGRGAPRAKISADAKLSVAVHHDGPLRTTLRATRGPVDRERDIVYAA